MIRAGLFAALLLTTATGPAETIRLTPAEAEAAIEAGAARRQAAGDLLPAEPARDRRVHGEIGMAIGTGGYRSVDGSVALPLGERGGAALGFERTQGRAYGPGIGHPCAVRNTLLCRSQLDLELAAGAP